MLSELKKAGIIGISRDNSTIDIAKKHSISHPKTPFNIYLGLRLLLKMALTIQIKSVETHF